MITKSDWEAVQQGMTAEDQRRLGEPPTAEEMLAYSRGELSGETAGRVRAWLAGNPDLVRALMEPFPADDAKPGDYSINEDGTYNLSEEQARAKKVMTMTPEERLKWLQNVRAIHNTGQGYWVFGVQPEAAAHIVYQNAEAPPGTR